MDKVDYDVKVKQEEDKEKSKKEYPYSLINLTLYCSYASFIFTSPFVPYDNFEITFVNTYFI